jgi:hypothetical protein
MYELEALRPGLSPRQIASLSGMDNPGVLDVLPEFGETAAEQQIKAAHFPAAFDLENLS